MPEANLGIGSPIKSFIEKVRTETNDGLGNWEVKAPIELELSAIVKTKKGGGLDIEVVNFGTKVDREHIQRVKLSIGPKDKAEEAENKARIAKAEFIAKLPQAALK